MCHAAAFTGLYNDSTRIFVSFVVCMVITEACRKIHKEREETIADAIGKALKDAPSKKGGYRYKVIIVKLHDNC